MKFSKKIPYAKIFPDGSNFIFSANLKTWSLWVNLTKFYFMTRKVNIIG